MELVVSQFNYLKILDVKLPLHAVKNIELVQSLGANQVIDYNEENFEDVLHNFDIAYDLLGDHVSYNSIDKCCKILTQSPDSHYITLTHPLVNTLDSKGLDNGRTVCPILKTIKK